jgi:glycerone phosphate O-acyltransferase/fatty acyl-CoA reductase
VVPITINYEKVLEVDTYPYELLGEEKVKESLPRLLKASKVLSANYGRIYIQLCQPTSVRTFFSQYQTLKI